jgi:hypothetical protein
VDGKSPVAAATPTGVVHLLAAFETGSGIVLVQSVVDGKIQRDHRFYPAPGPGRHRRRIRRRPILGGLISEYECAA